MNDEIKHDVRTDGVINGRVSQVCACGASWLSLEILPCPFDKEDKLLPGTATTLPRIEDVIEHHSGPCGPWKPQPDSLDMETIVWTWECGLSAPVPGDYLAFAGNLSDEAVAHVAGVIRRAHWAAAIRETGAI